MEIFIYIIMVLILTSLAQKKGRGLSVFISSLLLSPIFGLFMLIFLSDAANIKCPECDELISAKANVCKHCGFDPRKIK